MARLNFFYSFRSCAAALTAFSALALFNACADAPPPRRINTGIALPRIAAFDPSGRKDKEEHHKFALSSSLNRTIGYKDSGDVHSANLSHITAEFAPIPRIGMGLRPYLADVLGVESGLSLGIEGYFRWRAIQAESFHLSLEPSIRYTSKKSTEKFCRNSSGFLVTTCTGALITGYAEVVAYEPGVSTFFEFYPWESNNSLAFVPSVYWARILTKNHLEGYTGDYELDGRVWNYSGMFYYLHRFTGKKAKMMAHAGLGISTAKEFRLNQYTKRQIDYIGDFGFSIGF